MNSAEREILIQKRQKEETRIFEEKFKKIKVSYHNKIDNYLCDFDITRNIGDYQYVSNIDMENITLIKKALRNNQKILDSLIFNKKSCYYITRRSTYRTLICIFYGSEKETFEKAVIQKALSFRDIPHICEGKIIGFIDKKTIMDVMLKYDREYGKILLRIFNSQKSLARQ